jgi:tartrate-resistant acid phosphatase type 5
VELPLAAAAALCLVAACEPPPRNRYAVAVDAGGGDAGATCPQPAGTSGPGDRLSTHFAALGDYGYDVAYEAPVARLVDCFEPDFIITLGDNNYTAGAADWIDRNIGKYFHRYIFPYVGDFGAGASENRFFPTLGNHDWFTPDAQPYLDYFVLPGNERYYDIVRGDVHLFALDSDENEPDGITADSIQGQWLRERLAASTARWRVVYMHHPPYSSSTHGSTLELQWPYREWGASLVLSGHDHTYERLRQDGLTYVVCGVGGYNELYPITTPIPGSVAHRTDEYGALLVDADETQLRVRFYTISGELVDEVVLTSP